MDALVPEHVARLVPYVPGKPIEELERELGIRSAVKLASNENPYGPSPAAIAAMQRAAPEIHRYPDSAAYLLREALAGRYGVSSRRISLGNGSNELVQRLCYTFGTAQDHAVVGDPSFTCYAISLTAAGVPFTSVPLRDHLAWDVDALLEAVRPETKFLFLANPNNPTGAHVGARDLVRLLRELPPRVLAVIDEAYFEFADAPDYESALGHADERERLVVLRTFSKAEGLAAVRVGYAITTPSIAEYLDRVRVPFNVGSLAQVAALAALEDRAHVERYVEANRRERLRLAQAFGAMGLRVAPSQANFLLVDFARPGRDVYEALLRLGVIVRTVPSPIDSWLRITVGRPEENERLLEALNTLRGQDR